MDRVAFNLFGIDIMWYGILIGIGMVLGLILANKESDRLGLPKDTITDLSLFLIPLVIIGARLYYVIFSWDYYSVNPNEIFDIRGGGLAIHGGIIMGIIVGLLFCKIKKIDFRKLVDACIIGLPLGQAIGRWGNFINGEAHGGPTDLPWAIMVDGIKVHPTFLYESIWDFMLFCILMKFRKNKKYDGQILVFYIIIYSIGRFFIEGLRTDSLMFGPIRMAQAISLVFIVVGIYCSYLFKKMDSSKKNI